MPSQSHLQVFVPNSITHNEALKFPLFPLLPKELRLKIWRHALQRHRIIKLRLEAQREEAAQEAEITSADESDLCCAVVDGCQVLSKYLRVSAESREEALKFYRVHLPCKLIGRTTTKGLTSHGILYFNPEYDFLRISPRTPLKDTLFGFLYHLKTTYDPLNIGLLNLALDFKDLNVINLDRLQPSDLDVKVRIAFVETLTQLQEVFFVSAVRAGRQIFGLMSGFLTSETIFNRSFPIMATAPTFERLDRDPRPISHDLRKVFTGTSDLRLMLLHWQRLLKKWCICAPRIEYRYLLTFDPTREGDEISDRTSAKKWLQKEDDEWRNPKSHWDQSFLIQREDLRKAARPAFGFWLFPVEALGPFHGEGVAENEGFRPEGKRILDMREHWPELAFLSLSH
ncbi:MAG: hypothetical protein Q9190_006731 [Brigantiaea leucoxantha]